MTSEMVESQDIIVEHCHVDRISHLPRDVIECIMDFLPVRDAARTCVLSSKWRYVWADHPSLVLDWHFRDDIRHNRLPDKLVIDYVNIVNRIMLYHVGHIRRFVICVSVTCSMLHSNIDLWLSSLCRRGLKELNIASSYKNLYQVPCCVFSTPTLTHLSLDYCIIKAKDISVCFTNIQSLILYNVTLDLSVLTAPLLTSLTLDQCSFIHDFDIYAPRLASLLLDINESLNLKPFLTCTCIDYVYLSSFPKLFLTRNNGYFVDGESLNLVKLLAAWPRISELEVDCFCFEYLVTGSIPSILQHNNLRCLTLYNFNLDSELIAWILCILQNSPLLHTFEIWFPATKLDEVNDIGEPVITDFRMEQLRTIRMKFFRASRNEIIFAKTILQCAPVLEKLLVLEDESLLDPNERIHVLKKLLLLQRAFPKVEIIF